MRLLHTMWTAQYAQVYAYGRMVPFGRRCWYLLQGVTEVDEATKSTTLRQQQPNGQVAEATLVWEQVKIVFHQDSPVIRRGDDVYMKG